MVTKPQDIVTALKLCCIAGVRPSYASLGASLGMSASEVHAAIRRLDEARLIDPDTKNVRGILLRNFIVHGVPYAFPVRPQEITRGIVTAWAAPFIASKLAPTDQIPPVWPDPEGPVQGAAVRPLYPSVPHAARHDAKLYHLLSLVDALRIGRARERDFAEKELTRILQDHGDF